MTNPFATQKNTGGAFFKPAEHAADLALMIEPKRVMADQKNEYNGETTYRDEVVADISVFRNSQNVDNQTPFEVIRDARISHSALVSEAREHIPTPGADSAPMLVKVGKRAGKNYYEFKFDVPNDVMSAVAGYYTKREAALAEATADAPGFD